MLYLIPIFVALLTCGLVNSAHADTVPPRTLYVATDGADTNPGSLEKPFSTFVRAQHEVRQLIAAGLKEDVQVLLRGGVYQLAKPLTFDLQDSGTPQHSITYGGYSNETVVISGGRRMMGWQQKDNGLWSVVIPEVAAGQWYFRELYVNGRRASRTRSPSLIAKEQYFRLQESKLSSDLIAWEIKLAPPARVANWKNLADVELVAFRQRELTRKGICAVTPESASFALCPPHDTATNALFSAGALCYLENASAFLRQPGEWYLDRSNGELRYWPRTDEDLTQAEVIAPTLTQLIQIMGSQTNLVQNLHFRDLIFSHATWNPPAGGFNGFQAGFFFLSTVTGVTKTNRMDAAISLKFAETCSIQNCEIAHVGGSAIELRQGCRNNLLEGNHLQDVGATGLMVGEVWDWMDPADAVLSNRLVNNLIHHCGVTDFGAVGVWVGFAQNTLVAHNLLRDLPGTGMSVGWQWGPQETNCRTNLVLLNHIYNIGLLLADAAGIYMVGRQPGTIIRENVLHDLDHGRQLATGLYFDEGSPDGYLVESNLVYDTTGPLVSDKAWNAWRINNQFRGNILAKKGAYPAGVVGVGMLFNNESYLERPHEPALEPTNLTLEAWVKFRQFPKDPDPCVWIVNKNGDELTDGNYALAVSHGNVGAYLNIGGGRDNCYFAWSSGNPILSNAWNHLALTYDGQDLKVYCNGALQNSKAVNHRLGVGTPTSDVGGRQRSTGSGVLRIGKRDDNSVAFNGILDEIRIYDRALSAEEIATQYAHPSALGTQPSTTSSQLTADLRSLTASSSSNHQSPITNLPSDLVAFWPFDDLKIQFDQTVAAAGPQEPCRSRWHLEAGEDHDQPKALSVVEGKSETSGQRPRGDSK